MKIMTLNVNGIRSAEKKGFFDYLEHQNCDIICLQETRAQPSQLCPNTFYPNGYHSFYHSASRKGYSGVAIYTKKKPIAWTSKLHLDWADDEGRYLCADFGNLEVASVYMPSGSHRDDRQTLKYDMMNHIQALLKEKSKSDKPLILCGDINIAHTKKDIKNWRSNQKNSGFLPQEREWMDDIFTADYIDAFRQINNNSDEYTWWSNRGQAWKNNVGWRIDYQIASQALSDKITTAYIDKSQRFSDHSPTIIEYNF